MILGDINIVFWFGGLLLVGALGIFFTISMLVVRAFSWTLRLLFGGSLSDLESDRTQDVTVCPHSNCGAVNRAGARYCGRCGRAQRGLHRKAGQ